MAASQAFRRNAPGEGKRIHEVGENMKWRLRCANNFKAGHIQLPELREALGLDDTLVSEYERLRRADQLPWFAGEFGRGDRGMVVWGYPPSFFSVDGLSLHRYIPHRPSYTACARSS
jgi:hypothetical protein